MDNIEEAARIFAKWLSPDVKLPDITPSVRELTAQLTDKQGKAQGTIYFRAGTEPIVAEVTASAGTQLKFIDRITFLLNSAWPQNSTPHGRSATTANWVSMATPTTLGDDK